MTNTLHDRDFRLWIEQTIYQLNNREFEALDIQNLVEELVDLGTSDKNVLKRNLMILLTHRLNPVG